MKYNKEIEFYFLLLFIFVLGVAFYYDTPFVGSSALAAQTLFWPYFLLQKIGILLRLGRENQTLFVLFSGGVLTILFWALVIEALRPSGVPDKPPRSSSQPRAK